MCLVPGLRGSCAYAPGHSRVFFDITTGDNDQLQHPQDPNYAATPGWDPVTGLGTPNAANPVPDLIAAVHGH